MTRGMVQFEEVKAMEPAKYIGDSFERVSRILLVTLYNIACCYSSLKVADAGLEALEECLRAGFEDYDKVCSSQNAAPCIAPRLFLMFSSALHCNCMQSYCSLTRTYIDTTTTRVMRYELQPTACCTATF